MSTTFLGTLLVALIGAVASFVFMLLHPVGPALFYSVVSPFDSLFNVFGAAGNAVTFIPLLALAFRMSPTALPSIFLGTPIQIMMAVTILALSISHAMIIDVTGVGALLQYGRKATLLLVVAIFALYMRNSDHLGRVTKTLVVSMSAYIALSLFDFYLGIGLLPGVEIVQGGAVNLEFRDASVHRLRFHAGAISINQTANWILPVVFLSLGWLLSPDSRRRSIALPCTLVLVAGLGATISRSAILGFAVGFAVLFPTILRLRPSQAILSAIAVAFAAVGSLALLAQLGFLDTFISRFLPEYNATGAAGIGESGRGAVWAAALRVFASSPIIGVGDSMIATHPEGVGLGAHNTYLGLLAETGIVGFLPYFILSVMIFMRLWRPLGRDYDPDFAHWRPFFFAGWIAPMVMSLFNEYTWERMTWIMVAYAVALQAGGGRKTSQEQPSSPQDSGFPDLATPVPDAGRDYGFSPNVR